MRCDQCKFSVCHGLTWTCHKAAPVVKEIDRDRSVMIAGWPLVMAMDFCGEFQKKENK